MGAKTWMIVYSDEKPSEKFKSNPKLNQSKTDELVSRLFSGEKLEKIADGVLSFTCPPDGEIYAGCFEGVSVVAAKEFGIDYPSKLERKFLEEAAKGTTVYLHAMHSVVDWFAFAMWIDGDLVRSLSLSPDSGILEDIGEKFPFETDYWEGMHPAGDPEDEDEYPLKFHPLELGEEFLKAFFGYQLEGLVDDNLIDPESIPLNGYRRKKSKWKFW